MDSGDQNGDVSLTNGYRENGHSSHKERRKETEEERAIRKEKERKARDNETEEERKIRKEKERREMDDRHKKDKDKDSSHKEKRKETEEERAARKEKERRERGKETEEERAARKEKEKREKGKETEEERRIRKEKEKQNGSERKDGERRKETEEERAARKEKERKEKKHETEEERRARKEREKAEGKSSSHRSKETEEERAARKERERRERKEKERIEKEAKIKEERQQEPEGLELNEEYFQKEEARLALKEEAIKEESEVKEEEEESQEEESQEDEDKGENGFEEDGEDTADDVEPKEESEEEEHSQEVKKEEPMEESDEDVPLARRKKPKMDFQESEDEDMPLAKRKKPKASKRKAEFDSDEEEAPKKKSKKKSKKHSDDEDDFKPQKKSKKPEKKSSKPAGNESPTKKMTKKEQALEAEKNVWKWWEEDKVDDGTKWKFLEHKGPLFAPEYDPLPPEVRFWYDGKVMRLSEETEEVATFYGKMLDHDYTTKEVFNKNFFKDWRKGMTEHEKEKIRDLSKCDFTEINEHFKKVSEERKNRSKEEKNAEKERNADIQKEYGFCSIDGHGERIGNFRIEPPGLFRGRGEHPKQGMVKKRVMPEDVIINCSKNSNFPEAPNGHKWKKVQHDNTVTWLASWTENIQGAIKYVMLNPSSKLKGEKDMLKYEKARELKKIIPKIREDYEGDFKSKEMRVRQRSVALYFIDRLALRAGNEKDEDQADTVGCCSLRVEHIELFDEKDGKEYVVEFDFLGKDSIRYFNSVPVEKRVYKNVKMFKENKKPEDDLFDRLNTTTLNQYLNSLMDGLTAKVFRTYNASFTLQDQLNKLTDADDNVAAKMLSYNRANREVAVLCNHQRAVPKMHEKSMANLEEKIEKKQEQIKEAEKQLKHAKKAYKNGGSANEKVVAEKKKQCVQRLLEQLEKLEIQRTDKDENKTIALGTSKLNYLDPRISVAWCKKHDVPIDKVYNKTQREKFMWAIDMAGPDFFF